VNLIKTDPKHKLN